ncbi:MAG: glycosyltransferase family 4 protein [Phormidesmis sp.]
MSVRASEFIQAIAKDMNRTNRKRPKVLLIIEQCNLEGYSVPLVGYRFYEGISQFADTTLVTHARNKSALEKAHPDRNITYIAESEFIKQYYKVAERLSTVKGKVIWPLYNTLTYPVYNEFNHSVYSAFSQVIKKGDYDIVHALTPMMPRYPVKVIEACQNTPFILGPVNGGVPFPKGFQKVARKEFSYFNFLRSVGRFIIPGYRETYENADHILAGSTYTKDLVNSLFDIEDERIDLFYENGLSESFINPSNSTQTKNNSVVELLFVGRLVPYKGADMLIEAIDRLAPPIQARVQLSIVGDGSEKSALEQQVKQLNLADKIAFKGWVAQRETLAYYKTSDIFCFPSIREFGGAVVLEAMGNGLPCVVVNNGGIGEYVTAETGFRIDPKSREFVVQKLSECIEQLVENPALRQQMSREAIQRAKAFTWQAKAAKVAELYGKVMSAHNPPGSLEAISTPVSVP